MERKHIVVLTGAGISAESGLKTFRDADGLWNGYRIEEVATPEAWASNPQLVLDFYNMRRREALKAQPNAAHLALARLEACHDVSIVTQNVDDLHERAGSRRILHLHGQLVQMRSTRDPEQVFDIRGDIQIGDLAPDGAQLRPHIVWFGEDVPLIGTAIDIVRQADILVVIGTSLQVYPAAGLLNHFNGNGPLFVIDRSIPEQAARTRGAAPIVRIEKPATEGVAALLSILNCEG